ncbi:TAXI family TRAP transporter solute-binding subunit [Pseudalkalibacillus sp. A8]|uniref:TAXI family TRAP transporter solute-binding subunit n=1 Tax=Pseudalkalibacillus sp. A8 TaxID=3382641 RepID=UPI0038B53C0C
MKKLLTLSVVALLVLSLVACQDSSKGSAGSGEGKSPYSGAITTGSAGGVWNVLGGGVAKVINENTDYIKLNATTPPSVSQVPLMLNDEQAAFGIGMADMVHRAINGEDEFDQKHENIQTVMALYNNVMSAIVAEDSDLNNISELKGKKVGVSSESTQQTVAAIFEEAGVPEDEVKWQYLSYNEQVAALKDGVIDVAIITAYPKSGLFEEIHTTLGVKFLNTDEKVKENFDKKYPLWAFSTIPGGTYEGIEEDAEFYTVYSVLYTHKNVPDQVVHDVVKNILEHNDIVKSVHPAGEMITPERTAEYVEKRILDTNRFHPGALKYFEEQGVLEK